MFDEDSEKDNKQDYLSVNLESLSLEELDKYIIFLKEEIKRTQREISNKKSALGDAKAVFK